MYQQIIIKRDVKKCPQCQNSMEWVGGKQDDTEQEYICRHCRINVLLSGWSERDQKEVAEETFM